MNNPIKPAGWPREALVEIIDPLAAQLRAALDGAEGEPVELRDAAEADWRKRHDTALAKADAIMALAPPSSLDGGGAPVAYLKQWWSEDGKRRFTRVDLGEGCETWLEELRPDVTPLYALAAAPLPGRKVGGDADTLGAPPAPWQVAWLAKRNIDTVEQAEAWHGKLNDRAMLAAAPKVVPEGGV